MSLADSVTRRRVKVLWTIRSEVNADRPVRNIVCEYSVGDPDREPLVCGFVCDLLIAIFDDTDNRGRETSPTGYRTPTDR